MHTPEKQPTPGIPMKRKHWSLLLPLLAAPACFAQSTSPEVFSSSGGTGASPSAQLSWTIGEPVTETVSDAANSLTQGFHQPELDISTSVTDNDPAWSATVYPNPTSSLVRIDLDRVPQNATVVVFSASGEQVIMERMSDQHLVLDVTGLASGNYVIDLRDQATGRRARFNLNKTN